MPDAPRPRPARRRARPRAGPRDRIAVLLRRHPIDPRQLVLEMTGVDDDGPGGAVEVLLRLDDLGVELAVGGFGTGDHTLTRLATTPIDAVTIDRSFVVDIDRDPRRRALLAALLDLTRRLDLRTVVDGVDHPAQLEVLRRLPCDLVRGDLVGGPADRGRTTRLLLGGTPLTLLPAARSRT